MANKCEQAVDEVIEILDPVLYRLKWDTKPSRITLPVPSNLLSQCKNRKFYRLLAQEVEQFIASVFFAAYNYSPKVDVGLYVDHTGLKLLFDIDVLYNGSTSIWR